MLNLEAFNVIDEFFRRTSAWQIEIPIELVEDQTDYAFPTSDQLGGRAGDECRPQRYTGAIAGSQGALVQSSLGVVQSELQFPDGDVNILPDLSDLEAPSAIFSWAIFRPDYLSITTPADEGQRRSRCRQSGAVGRQELPREDCAEWDVPEWMWSTYFQDWYDGMLGRLYGMPAKPWASPIHAQYHGKRFRNCDGLPQAGGAAWLRLGQPGPWRFPRGW